MSEMALTADHLIVIGRGRLLADTSMSDFIEKNSRSYVRLRTPQPERLKDVMREAGHTVVAAGDGAFEVTDADAATLGELAARHQLVLHELSPQRASLEEAFMQLTAESVEYHAGGRMGSSPAGGPGVLPGEQGWQPGPGGGAGGGAGEAGGPPGQPGQPGPGQPGAGQPAWGAQWRDSGTKKGR
jgi:ABC-2 type transport system ATP-binding protein